MKRFFENNIVVKWILYAMLILLSVLNFLHWANMKEVYYADEVYTYESVNGFEQEWPRAILDEWMGSERIVSYLAADVDTPGYVQISTVLYGDHVPLFFWMTRFISLHFFKHQASIWICLSSNLVFYLILISLLYFIFCKISSKPFVSFVVVVVSMLYNRTVLEQTTMLRMYIMMLMLIAMLLALGIYIFQTAEKEKTAWIGLVLLTPVSLAGLLTHYDFWIYYALTAFCICLYSLILAIKKEKKKFYKTGYFKNIIGWCISFAISLGATIKLFPYCVWNLHKDKGWAALTSVSSISNSKFENIVWGFKTLAKSFFSSTPAVIGLIIVFGVLAGAIYISIKTKNRKQLINLSFPIVISFLYQIAVCFTLPAAREERYIWCSNTILYLCFAYSIYIILDYIYGLLKDKKYQKLVISCASFVIISPLVFAQYCEINHGKGITYLFFEGKDTQALKDHSDIPWVVYGPCEAHSFFDFVYSSEICFMTNTACEADYVAAEHLNDTDTFLIYAYESQVSDAEVFFEDALNTELTVTYLTASTNFNVYLVSK